VKVLRPAWFDFGVLGALARSLATMVANLSSHKKGWDARWEEFSDWAEKGQQYKKELLKVVDADTKAFNQIMMRLVCPKSTRSGKKIAYFCHPGCN
jgi:glutamate formiminotransferase/formiminotetrahydrofolate cyclodeaminase